MSRNKHSSLNRVEKYARVLTVNKLESDHRFHLVVVAVVLVFLLIFKVDANLGLYSIGLCH